MSNESYRLVTRSDFDGLVCAVLLKELDIIDDIKFVHPKDMQDGKIDITDKAEFDNKSERSRKGVDAVALNGLAGYQEAIKKLLPNSSSIDLSKFFDIEGSSSSEGEGAVERQEKLETEMAAVVTQRLPKAMPLIQRPQPVQA